MSHFFLSSCRPEAPHRELISHFSTERVFPWLKPSECDSSLSLCVLLDSFCVLSPPVSVCFSFVYRTVARWRGCLEVVTPLMSSMIHVHCRGNTRLCFFWPSTSVIGNILRCVWPQMTQTDSDWFILHCRCTKVLHKRLPSSWNRSQPTLGPPWRGCWYIRGMRQELQELCLWHGDKGKIL